MPRQYQSGETDRNGRITKRGNPLARTILVECAWASLRYNPWAKAVYERISGKQKTRKKKAAVALARKIAVLAWAMLRDEKDWEPKRMIEVAESFGRMSKSVKESLGEMKPKENSDQRRSRRRREAREIRAAEQPSAASTPAGAKPVATRKKATSKPTSQSKAKPRQARKPVCAG